MPPLASSGLSDYDPHDQPTTRPADSSHASPSHPTHAWRPAPNNPDALAAVRNEVLDTVPLALSLARPRASRPPIRTGLVFRLWLQHAPQRLPRTAPHEADGMARRPPQRLPAALQPGRPPDR